MNQNGHKEKILELRKLIPIAIQNAKEVLQVNNGDVLKSFNQVKHKFLKSLQDETGYSIEDIEPIYSYHKYDYNRTLDHFKTLEEDKKFNSQKLTGIPIDIFDLVFEFRRLENHEGLLDAILFDQFEKVYLFFKIQLELNELADILLKARTDYLKRTEIDNFKQTEVYRKALKIWCESQIKFDESYKTLQRNFKIKNENTTTPKPH